MRDVAIVSFAQYLAAQADGDEVEMLVPVIGEAVAEVGLRRQDVDFVCSGSCDYLIGRPFSFVSGLDAVGAWPPLRESHVEMDGAWALYEAWIRLQHEDVEVALVYGFGRASLGDLAVLLSQQLDPYTMAPLGPDAVSLAALQARALLDAGKATERDFAAVAARNRQAAMANPHAHSGDPRSEDALLESGYEVAPLRAHDVAPVTDGAAAVVLAVGDRARELCARPAWITGIDHRIDAHDLGLRDLTTSPSTRRAAEEAGVAAGPVHVAEIHAPFSHQEIIVQEALGLGPETRVNPSGGALGAHPTMAAGLVRVGEAARRIHGGEAGRVVAHATSGPCLQQNLVAVMEARDG